MIEAGESPRTNAINAGDTAANNGLQGFITFDVISIPDGANFLSAKLVPAQQPLLQGILSMTLDRCGFMLITIGTLTLETTRLLRSQAPPIVFFL